MPSTVQFHRVLRSTPERVYRAFRRRGRHGQVAAAKRIHRQSAPCGRAGRWHLQDVVYKFHVGKSHSFGGEYLELVPNGFAADCRTTRTWRARWW